jgi:hypothetical protein
MRKTVTRVLMLLLGLLATNRATLRPALPRPAGSSTAEFPAGTQWHTPAGSDDERPRNVTVEGRAGPLQPGEPDPYRPDTGRWQRRRRIVRRAALGTAVAVAALVFRKAILFLLVSALAAVFHLVGLNVHLPAVKFAWPWQPVSASTTNTDLGPWVLQKIEGISRPALGKASFDFYFTHTVSKNIGPWPCWYSSTFYAVAYASATVDLNPGPSWWAPATGHYRLQVLSTPAPGKPGQVAVTMVLPQPQLPQSVHDVTIDNIPSKPIDSQHSWTYPGLGCGVLLKPQFPQSVLYSQAQQIAFDKAVHSPQITRPLIATAQAQAAQTIRDNFLQPTVNAFGYTLTSFTLRWASSP